MAPFSRRSAVRRIVLPSGRSIEVVRFDEIPASGQPLHICPGCGCDLVQPHDWSEIALERWRITLRCPNCEGVRTDTVSGRELEQLEEHLDMGIEEMIDDLRRLTHANMVSEADRFAVALAHDLILPEDF
jgi:hypothetical protein